MEGDLHMRTFSIVSAILVLLISVGWGSSQPAFAEEVTFGDGTIETSRSSLNNNQMTLLRVQVPSSGTITKLSVYTARLSGSPVLTGVVYADSNGVLGGFLGKTSEITVTNALTSPAWLDLSGPNIPIRAGYVWIGLMVGPSTGSHEAAFWINMSAPPYRLDSNIFVTYPNAPATATGYTAWTNVSWSITGTVR
jgi:hypothetical protein